MRTSFEYYDKTKKQKVVREVYSIDPLVTLSSFNNYFIFKRTH